MPTISDLLKEGSEEIVRSHIKKIVEIYDLEWIVAHELIQNAIDAVQSLSTLDKGVVEVSFNIDEDIVIVKDNGIGFKHDLNLLKPGGTGIEKRLSSRSPAKGYQGVGLKAVMYSTERFEIESRSSEEYWTFISEHLSSYIKPNDEAKDPEYLDEKQESRTEQQDDGGQTFTKVLAKFNSGTLLKFLESIEKKLEPSFQKWKHLYNQEAEKKPGDLPYNEYLTHFLGWYFRSQSYIGCVNSLLQVEVCNPENEEYFDIKPVDIHIKMYSSSNFANTSGQIGDWLKGLESSNYSMTLPYKSWDFAEIALKNSQNITRFRLFDKSDIVSIKPNDPNWDNLSGTFRNKFLDLKLTVNEKGKNFREKYSDIISILERPRSSVKAEDFEDFLEKVTGIYLAIGRTSHFETLGIPNRGLRFISSNGTPTAHELTVRSTSSTWYLETIHFVINIDATLNIGKRHLVNNHLVGRARDFFEACYPKLVSISKLFVERDNTGGGEDVPMPDVVKLKNISRKDIPFQRFPEDENTLLGIFCSAIGLLDQQFSIFGLFGKARYDGKFLWQNNNPGSERDLNFLEFKLNLQDLIEEFDLSTHDKEFNDLALVVVWDRRINKPGWAVKGIATSHRNKLESQGVPTDLVQYILEDNYGRYCPLICVADLLEKIELQKETDDIEEYVRLLG